ncbi:MAG TPA: hypothetical protein PLM33_08140 [Acidobacteriota bacterium]|nr:hypothetical protein [Acidobacteriota bacterium]
MKTRNLFARLLSVGSIAVLLLVSIGFTDVSESGVAYPLETEAEGMGLLGLRKVQVCDFASGVAVGLAIGGLFGCVAWAVAATGVSGGTLIFC